jgi:DNA-binding transcriptional MerR regulator
MTLLRSGEVAERAGVNVETLRYYERRGLIPSPARSLGGHRTYSEETVALLHVIKSAQRLGFTLVEVADLLDGTRKHPTSDLRMRAAAKLDEIEQKMTDLAAMRASLKQVVDAECDSLIGCTHPDCPVPSAKGSGRSA